MGTTDFASNYIFRKQLAKELGKRLRGRPYSKFTLTLIAWERDGKGLPVGRDLVYSIPSVEKWLKQQEQPAEAKRAGCPSAL
jgi:hypothetical protein